MGCRQCLPLSVVQLKGKHCWKPIAIMELYTRSGKNKWLCHRHIKIVWKWSNITNCRTVCLFLGLPSMNVCWQRQLAQPSQGTSYTFWSIAMPLHGSVINLWMTCTQMYFCTPSYWKSSATEMHSLIQASFNWRKLPPLKGNLLALLTYLIVLRLGTLL
jgi:hypothetical protein